MRNTWAAYLVDIASGRIEWTLGGRHSSFKFGPSAAFEWQHDVTLQPDSTVTCSTTTAASSPAAAPTVTPTGAVARAGAQARPAGTRTATLAAQYGARRLSTPTTWATPSRCPTATCSSAGARNRTSRSTSRSGQAALRRRAARPEPQLPGAPSQQWVGQPLVPARRRGRERKDGKTTVYASWNGATELASWTRARRLGRRRAGAGDAAKAGFETAIPVKAGGQGFTLQALDANGRVLGRSRPFSVSSSS